MDYSATIPHGIYSSTSIRTSQMCCTSVLRLHTRTKVDTMICDISQDFRFRFF